MILVKRDDISSFKRITINKKYFKIILEERSINLCGMVEKNVGSSGRGLSGIWFGFESFSGDVDNFRDSDVRLPSPESSQPETWQSDESEVKLSTPFVVLLDRFWSLVELFRMLFSSCRSLVLDFIDLEKI